MLKEIKVSELKLGNLTINLKTRQAYRKGEKLNLRKKEYQLLEFLAINKNRVVNRLTLLEYVWNYSLGMESNTLEVHMAGLRRKLRPDYTKTYIETVYGLGYKLCETSPSMRALK